MRTVQVGFKQILRTCISSRRGIVKDGTSKICHVTAFVFFPPFREAMTSMKGFEQVSMHTRNVSQT